MTQIYINDFIKHNIPDEKIFETDWLKNKFINIIINHYYFNVSLFNSCEKDQIEKIKKEIKIYIQKLFNLAKKCNYELAYIILLLDDLLISKENMKELLQDLSGIKIISIDHYTEKFKIFFAMISLIIGKYYDDLAMENIEYVNILKKLINYKYQRTIYLNELNKYEVQILKMLEFHIKDKSVKFIKLYNECIKNNI
jgi:hypothetical protein